MRCTGTLYFEERGTTIAYGIQTNSTATGDHGRFEDPNFTYQIPLQVAAEREIARLVSGGMSGPRCLSFDANQALEAQSRGHILGALFGTFNVSDDVVLYGCQMQVFSGMSHSLSLPIQQSTQRLWSEELGLRFCWQRLCLVL